LAADSQKDFYQIKIYRLKNNEQVKQTDDFLQNAYLPALHKAGITKVGVFKPVANDTAAVKTIYVFIPFKSADEWMKLSEVLEKDASYKKAAKNFFEAAYDSPPYERIESIMLDALSVQPHFNLPSPKSTKRVYELRSYESPTESLFVKKLKMFNEAGEVDIFKRLGFNALFYAKVLSGCHTPNLMYMTWFDSIESRDAHWKSFSEDPGWKELSGRPEFENKVSVSHIDSILMRSTDYSDI